MDSLAINFNPKATISCDSCCNQFVEALKSDSVPEVIRKDTSSFSVESTASLNKIPPGFSNELWGLLLWGILLVFLIGFYFWLKFIFKNFHFYFYLLWGLIFAAFVGTSVWVFLPKPLEVIETAITEIPDIIGCRDSTATNFNPRATVACADCCDYSPAATEAPPARQDLNELAQRDSVSVPPRFAAINDKPLPRLDPLPDDTLQWLSDYKWPVSFLLWGLLLVFTLGYYLWRRANRQYLARQERADEPPYRLPIKIRRAQPIALSDEFFLAVNRLRGRELGERRTLDVRKTVAATIRRGGFANFQYRTLTRPVEYLILIDKQAEQHHQAQLFEYIYREIVRQEVYAERYFFEGDPRYCWNDQHPAGVPLERLLQRHSTARLLVLADGYSFINPASGQLEDWTKALGGWSQRALLSPSPVAGWNFREAILARFFLLLPGNVHGLTQVVRHFEGLPTPSLRDWKYDLGREDLPLEPNEERVVDSLNGQLSPALMRWLTACAVYPELHWDLTLELGNALNEPGQELVNFDNVLQLARLPWFRDGHMPAGVREQLLHSSYLNDADRLAVRAAIVHMLEANTPENTHSYAYEEHQLHLAINQTLLSRLPAERQEWIRRYRELHAKGVREDQVSMVELDRHFNTLLDFQLPQTLFPKGRRMLGLRSGIPVLLAAILALLVWGLGRFVPDPCGGTVAQLTLDAQERYCLQSPEDSLAFFAHEAVLLADTFQLDSLLKRTAGVAELQPDTPAIARKDSLYYSPVQAHLWNRAVAAYDTADYANAATLAGKLKELLEAEANDRTNQRRGSTSMLDDSSQEKWRYYWRCLELLGRSAFFANDRELAQQFAGQVAAAGAYDSLLAPPHLRTLLTYDFVDTLHLNRIRIRQEGRYGFLDEQGRPVWNEGTPPFDYAWNYQEEQDTIKALTVSGTSQCYIDLAGNRIPGSCFLELIRFQDTAGLFGYENENGFIVIPAQYSEAGAFTADRLAWVKKDGESGYGYIRFDGSDLLARNDLEAAGDYRQGLAAVKQDGQYGYLDTRGHLAIGLLFDEAGDFTPNGQARVRQGNRTYTIDRSGKCSGGDCPEFVFTGTVRDQRLPGEGWIEQAEVTLNGNNLGSAPKYRAFSDSKGVFRIAIPSDSFDLAGRRLGTLITVAVNKTGYTAFSRDIRVHSGQAEYRLGTIELIPEGAAACPDTDQDGVCNDVDQCPDQAGPAGNNGCPEVKLILPEMITIPGGTFTMGCLEGRDTDCYDRESPAHEVTVATFGLGKYEVTVREYLAFADATNGNYPEWLEPGNSYHIETGNQTHYKDLGYSREAGDLPIVGVSWNDALAYCRWLSEQTGETYRLPTEAEWEYAARGGAKGQGYLYAGGNEVDVVAWYSQNSDSRTHRVGQKRPNELGLYDMSGNVFEWCRDWYGPYSSEAQPNPTGPENGALRVIRGGSWSDGPANVRCANSYYNAPDYGSNDLGFRLSRAGR